MIMALKYSGNNKSEPFTTESSDISNAYDDYLLLLQQRNRLLKKLKEKDEEQLKLERREQGFSLFLNGANVGLHLSGRHKSRKNKSAGDEHTRPAFGDIDPRLKTAPSKSKRKGWNEEPVDVLKIKSQSGEKLQVNIPDFLSGKYSEDFEVDDSIKEEPDHEESECEEEIEKEMLSQDEYSSEDEQNNLQLTFTIEDAKLLRASLQTDSGVIKSLREEVYDSDNNSLLDMDEEYISEDDHLKSGSEVSDEDMLVEDIDETDSALDECTKKKDNDILELTSVVHKYRPVSSSEQRKPKNDFHTNLSADVLSAIEEENKKLAEFKEKRKLQSPLRTTQTAPGYVQAVHENKPEVLESRPQTVSTLTEADITSITQKVRQMTGRQQRKLLNMLAELENSESLMNSWSEVAPAKDLANKKSLHYSECSAQDNKIVGSETSAFTTNLKKKSLDDKHLHLRIEFYSNWGNDTYIGLTELEFFDINNKYLTLRESDIKIASSHSVLTDIKCLINNKTKTTKESYMLKCKFVCNESLKIDAWLPIGDFTKLSKVVIWNYNQSLQDLNIGVKHCKIFVEDKFEWEGIISKGCGNQIFDYGHIVILNNVLEDTKEDKTMQDSHSTKSSYDMKCLPDIKIQSFELPSRSKSTPLVNSFTKEKTQEKITKDISTSSLPPPIKSSSEKLSWLEDSPKVKKSIQSNSSKNIDSIFTEEYLPRSRPSSGRRSQLNFDSIDQPNDKKKSSQPFNDSTDDAKELNDLFDLNVKPKNPKNGRRSQLDSAESILNPPLSPLLKQSSMIIDTLDSSSDVNQRKKNKDKMDGDFEQFLKSIDNFKFHHMGRITSNFDDDDDINSLLEPMKQKDIDLLHQSMDTSSKETVKSDERFQLPVLPKGKELILNIKSTWGDSHYVGLNGIEVFTKEGTLAKVKTIEASPEDINVLPEYEGDPRVVKNLIDGCYMTRDDSHLWLTPFTPGGDHFVVLHFEEEITIAMIRIWNYNKSRIHSSRGACFVEMALDGKLIFIGEIARASGILSSSDPYGDMILFTTEEEILENVAANDSTFLIEYSNEEEAMLALSSDFDQRPSTADKTETPTGRPFTCPKSRDTILPRSFNIRSSIEEEFTESKGHALPVEAEVNDDFDGGFCYCQVLSIFLSSTWGDQHYLGLTGLEVLGETFEKIPLTLDMLEANPRDLNDLEEYGEDDRTLDKLIDGVNVTMSDEHMWLIPFDEEGTHLLKINFKHSTIVTGIRVWNYNKSPEDTCRGTKTIHVYMDDQEVSPLEGFLVRKGPGHCHFDFAQDIIFNQRRLDDFNMDFAQHRKINLQKVVNEYETLIMPCGFVFQLKLFSSWGDPYYIGLNGIQIFDKYGKEIQLTDNNITAYPHSVNVLDGVADDARTPDKLIDGVNDTYDGGHMWLAPILPSHVNIVYIVFDEPVTVSMIKLWNYSKTPNRGVRQFGLLVDDLLVYSGVLPQCGAYARAILPGLQTPLIHHTILFTDDEEIAIKERGHILSSTIEEQSVKLTNDRSELNPKNEKVIERGKVDPAMRPKTSVKSPSKIYH